MKQTPATIQADFDRLARLADRDFDHNTFYHTFLLRQLPAQCTAALEVGCGSGEFARLLAARAERVMALDLSPEMIRLARRRTAHCSNIDYQITDVSTVELRPAQFDCIVSIATLHHLPLAQTLSKLKTALRVGGVLVALDLFQAAAFGDFCVGALAVPVNLALRLGKTGRLRAPRELRAAWAAHGSTDHYLTLAQVRQICAEVLPGATVRRHLLWRYSLVWRKEGANLT